jgi:hypothetical protein
MAAPLKTVPPDLTVYALRPGGNFSVIEMPKRYLRRCVGGESHGTRKMPIWGPIFSEVRRDQDVGKSASTI